MAAEENIMDFNKICRLCLTEESVMSSIYNDQDKHSAAVPLPLRIMACVSIELNSVDGLPSHICTTCLCQVDGWYKFKDLCETADAVLKKCINNEPVQVETISQIRSKAQEIRQFFASPHLVKVEGLDSALTEIASVKEPMEMGVNLEGLKETSAPLICRQKCVVYVSPEAFVEWLRTEYKLNEKVAFREMPKSEKSNVDVSASYEIAFDSQIDEKREKRIEKVVMELGDCQLLAVSSSEGDDGQRQPIIEPLTDVRSKENKEKNEVQRWKTAEGRESLANYEKTKEFLERSLRERGNIHEETIENVLYTFRLDEEGQVDVVNIVEGVIEPNLQRGFRYACLFCSKIVLNKLVYEKHVRKVHLNRLVCKVCDKQLFSLRNFLIHTKTHLGVYTFICPICGKGLTRGSIFKAHMAYHYRGKAQKCQICEKKFRDVFALRRHIQVHDKKIEFVCELCGFGTHLKSNLDYHVRGHAGEKAFMCAVCGKRFAASQNLRHHMKTHEPNYPCPHCKRVYRHENKFLNHLKRNHFDLIGMLIDDNDDDTAGMIGNENIDGDNDDLLVQGDGIEIAKNIENRGEDGLKLYSLLKCGPETVPESTDGKPDWKDSNEIIELKTKSFAEDGIPDEEEIGEEDRGEGVKTDVKDFDFSSDDDVSLSTKKEIILQEKGRNSRKKEKKKETVSREEEDGIRYFRTIKMQTERGDAGDKEEEEENVFNEEGLEVIETEMERNFEKRASEKRKMKSRKTQTPKDGESGGKKRFRIRPAVPSSCTLCDKVYKNSEILRQHMKSHHVTGTIECSSCKLTFTSLRSLKYHEQRKHSNLEPVPCTFCGKKFLDKKYLRIHENIHSQANHFVCQFCGRKFIMKTNLTVHISRHHTKKSNDFICQICGKAFPFKLYLKKHFKTHTDDKPYQCTHCEARFRENTLLQKHVNSIHLKLRPFLCQYCHKTFTRSLYLREHMESQHLGIQRKVECSRCGENFQNRNRLRQHECPGRTEPVSRSKRIRKGEDESKSGSKERKRAPKVKEEKEDDYDATSTYSCEESRDRNRKRKLNYLDVTYDKPFPTKDGKIHQCRICEKYLKNVTTRNRHEIEKHPPPLPCDRCPKAFSTVQSYHTHKNIHLGLTKHKCRYCGKHLASRSNLEDHEKVHTKAKPIGCSQCEKTFSSLSNLRVHLKFHAGIKTHFCHVCGKGHVTLGNLQLHLKRHLNEKNHVCHVCGKGFKAKNELKIHIDSHDSEKKFSCRFCFQKLKTASSLKRHIDVQHLKLRPYRCDACLKTFGRKENLREHVRIHEINENFLCENCDKHFINLKDLKNHKCP